MDVASHILGTVEFESSEIPVVDPGAASGMEPVRVDHSTCILIVEQDYRSQQLFTGIIIKDFDDIERIAAGISKLGRDPNASENARFALALCDARNHGSEILIESHRILGLIEETADEFPSESSGPTFGGLRNLIEAFRAMDLANRLIVLEELAARPELWDKERDVMVL
jgi:chemotaxis signal transduction protein